LVAPLRLHPLLGFVHSTASGITITSLAAGQ